MSMDIFRDGALGGKSILSPAAAAGSARRSARRWPRKGAKVHICGRRPQVLEEAAAEISAGRREAGLVPRLRHARRGSGRGDDGGDLGEGPLTGLVNNAAANFIAPTKDLSPRGFRADHLDRHGRQLSCDARGRKALDRRRPQGLRGQQSRHLGLDRLGLRRALGDGQDRAACDDHVARGGMGPLRHPSQRHGAGAVPDRGRLGETEPDPRRDVLARRAPTRCRSAATARCRNCRTSSSSCCPTAATISPGRPSRSTAASIWRALRPSPI